MTIRKTNNPRFSTEFRKASLEDRFHMSYVKCDSGCWEWIGALHVTGYGVIQDARQKFLTHRLSYRMYRGDPGGLCVLHACDNRRCVNPEHLFLGTRKDNNADRDSKGRGPRGERNWCAILRPEDIPSIKSLHASGMKQAEIAQRYGVSQGTISQVVNNQTWRHLGV